MGLTIGVLVVVVITQAAVSMLEFIVLGRPPGKSGCKSDFWSRECCWYTFDERSGKTYWECTTCLDNGDGTYRDCTVVSEPVGRTNAGVSLRREVSSKEILFQHLDLQHKTHLQGVYSSKEILFQHLDLPRKTSLVRHKGGLHREVSSEEI